MIANRNNLFIFIVTVKMYISLFLRLGYWMKSIFLQCAEEDHVLRSEAPEQLLSGRCGEIVLTASSQLA